MSWAEEEGWRVGTKGVDVDINSNLITVREKIYWLDCVTVGEYITCPSIGG